MIRSLMIIVAFFLCATSAAAAPRIGVVTIDGPINPVKAEHLKRALREAPSRGEQLFVVEIDTPGGLDTAMRESVKDILASSIPVVAYVAPSGARAASAGAVIALAADVCAMAPGTNIGAAHPVTLGEKQDEVMKDKVLNDAEAYVEGIAVRRGRNAELAGRMVRESLSVSAERGVEGGVVDLIATDRADLLAKLEGRTVARGKGRVTLHTAGAELVRHEMGGGARILDTISDPNVAYLLMLLGFLGLVFELSSPGAIFPGVVGGISLILAFFALQMLPVNFAGILLILLAIILFAAEVQVISHGILGIGGLVSLVFGSLLLFKSTEPWLRLSHALIGITAAVAGALVFFVLNRGLKVHRSRPATGSEGLVGETGVAETDLAPEGRVAVHGEYWDAWSETPVAKGERVVVTGLEGLRLKVQGKGEAND